VDGPDLPWARMIALRNRRARAYLALGHAVLHRPASKCSRHPCHVWPTPFPVKVPNGRFRMFERGKYHHLPLNGDYLIPASISGTSSPMLCGVITPAPVFNDRPGIL
jgi:hypothetical protein